MSESRIRPCVGCINADAKLVMRESEKTRVWEMRCKHENICDRKGEPMSDLINRQEVLDLIDDYNSDGLGSVFFSYDDGEKFKDEILALPSVQKTGKWVINIHDIPICDRCGYMTHEYSNYCPNCGARMVGEEE